MQLAKVSERQIGNSLLTKKEFDWFHKYGHHYFARCTIHLDFLVGAFKQTQLQLYIIILAFSSLCEVTFDCLSMNGQYGWNRFSNVSPFKGSRVDLTGKSYYAP